jgi:hypothetical protein
MGTERSNCLEMTALSILHAQMSAHPLSLRASHYKSAWPLRGSAIEPYASFMEPQSLSVTFGGHQTFSFRHGWLEKGFRAIGEAADVFGAEDAIVRLGVGKNMVESIRHWCVLAQLIENDADDGAKRARSYRPTDIGSRLLDPESGWDPYLEDDASLWLIHWLLVSNPVRRTVWQVVFAHFHKPEFSKAELSDFLKSFLERYEIRVSASTLARDLDCFLKTYVAPASDSEFTEENFDCPLADLGLIRQSPESDTFHFDVGPKYSLPPAVFYFAFEQFFEQSRSGKQTMTIQECLYGAGSPGQAFKLDENALFEHIEALSEATDGALLLDDTAGLKQIYRRRTFAATRVLEKYYQRKGAIR